MNGITYNVFYLMTNQEMKKKKNQTVSLYLLVRVGSAII